MIQSRRIAAAAALLALGLSACETTPEPLPRDEGAPVISSRERAPVTVPSLDPEIFRGDEAEAGRPDDGVTRVAILLPLTAASSNVETVAASMLQAAQMVAFESRNEQYLLIPKDTNGTAEGAFEAAGEAIREGAEVILGPLFSDSVEAIAPLARANEVPVIAFSTDLSVAGDGVYLLSFPPEDEVRRVTSYATSQGYARFGMMAPYTEFGDKVASAFSEAVYEQGGEVVAAERYERSFDAMAQPARRLSEYAAERFVPEVVTPRGERRRLEDAYAQGVLPGGAADEAPGAPSSDPYDPSYDPAADPGFGTDDGRPAPRPGAREGFQAVFLPEQGRFLRALAPWLPTYDVDVREVKLLGLSGWDNPLLTREPALAGGWFAAPDPSLAEGFKSRYEKAYGEKPPRLASLAYDAALLTARLSELEPGQRFTPTTIANPNGYLGADGLFRLRPDGTVERGLAILEIRPSGIRVVDPAPRSFVERGY